MKEGKLLAHVYSSLFNYPLTDKEAQLWRIKLHKRSEVKIKQAHKVAVRLQKIPFIEAIFLTGSVAANNADSKADIDLMVVTSSGTMWLTRILVVLYLKFKRIYKRLVCPNIFLDTDNLVIKKQDLYTAHEVLQAKPLFDRGDIYYHWLKENSWTKDYLPNAYRSKVKNLDIKNSLKIKNFKFKILLPLEIAVFIFQYLYQKRHQTNESVGWGYAFFHPRNLSGEVLKKFNQKLQSLGIMKK